MTLVTDVDRAAARREHRREAFVAILVLGLLFGSHRWAYELGVAHTTIAHQSALVADAQRVVAAVMDSVRALVPPPCFVNGRDNPRCPEYLETLEAGTDSAQYQRNQRRGIR